MSKRHNDDLIMSIALLMWKRMCAPNVVWNYPVVLQPVAGFQNVLGQTPFTKSVFSLAFIQGVSLYKKKKNHFEV